MRHQEELESAIAHVNKAIVNLLTIQTEERDGSFRRDLTQPLGQLKAAKTILMTVKRVYIDGETE